MPQWTGPILNLYLHLHPLVQLLWFLWACAAILTTIVAIARSNPRLLGKGLPWWHTAFLSAGSGLSKTTLIGLVGLLVLSTASFMASERPWDELKTTVVEGRDDNGLRGNFEFTQVSQEYYWKFGSSTEVVNADGRTITIELKLTASGVVAVANKATDLIAVGMASCVGAESEEADRASDRARSIVGWLRELPLAPTVEHLHMLNLGQYQKVCGAGLREQEQRIVLIVGVVDKEPGLDLRESFRDAFENYALDEMRRFDFPSYSNWPPERFVLEEAM